MLLKINWIADVSLLLELELGSARLLSEKMVRKQSRHIESQEPSPLCRYA